MTNTKQHSVINAIKEKFEGEDIQTQYSVMGYRIEFHKYDFAVEIDEYGHCDRSNNYEK